MKNERKKHIKTRFSTEDKKEFIELTLVELRKGETTANIAVDLGICNDSVQDNINRLISDGRITKTEIDKARAEKKKRDKFESPDIQKILEGLREGKTTAEIEREVKYAYNGVKYNIRWLIAEGYITRRRNR